MRTAKELYSQGGDGFGEEYDYQPILAEFGTIILQVDDDDYQGDSRVLYKDNGKIGYLEFGWGSCSGCDSLQACENYDEIQELMDELRQSIMWFESEKEALRYFKEHDWEGDFSWHAEEQKEFVAETLKILDNAE